MRRDELIDGYEGNSVGKEVSVTTMSESQKIMVRKLIVLALIVACIVCTVSLAILAYRANNTAFTEIHPSINASGFTDVYSVQFSQPVQYFQYSQMLYTEDMYGVFKIRVAIRDSIAYVRIHNTTNLEISYYEYVVSVDSVIIRTKK